MMNTADYLSSEYLYILRAFLPEIAMIGLGLLALIVDLLLPKRSTRRTLAVLAAVGCLVVAGLAAHQWQQTTILAPRFVQNQALDMAQRAATAITTEACGMLGGNFCASNSMPVDGTLALLRESGPHGQWPLRHTTEMQAMRLLQFAHAPRPDLITSQQARELIAAYRALRLDGQQTKNAREVGEAFAALPSLELGLSHPGMTAWWLFNQDRFGAAFKLIFALAAFLVLLLSVRYPVARYRGEFIGLLCFAAVGLMVMSTSVDLVTIFLGLEMAAICFYALAAWHKDDARSAESGTKYLLLGSLASAFFIYGASLLFVKFGSTNLAVLAAQSWRPEPLTLIGLLMLLVGFGFKVAAAPFHLWAPDVYQGAPVSVAAFLSTASKAAGFAVLLRILGTGFLHLTPQWATLIGVLAGLSVMVGNLVAVHQNNVKRLLAYSGIAQAGYLLIAVMALGLAANRPGGDPTQAVMAVVLYLFLYTAGNIGAFAVVGMIEQETGDSDMRSFAGLRTRSPLLAFAMLLLLLSLGGIPLLAGFVGKWFLFLSGVVEGQYLLVLLGAAMSTVSIYYYLLIAKQMYIYEAQPDAKPIRIGALAGVGLLVILLLTVAIGVYPRPFLDLAHATAQALLTR